MLKRFSYYFIFTFDNECLSKWINKNQILNSSDLVNHGTDCVWRVAPSTSHTSNKLHHICVWDYQVPWPPMDCVGDFVAAECVPPTVWFRTLLLPWSTRSHRCRPHRLGPCRWTWWFLWRFRQAHRWWWILSHLFWRFCRKLRFELGWWNEREEKEEKTRNFLFIVRNFVSSPTHMCCMCDSSVGTATMMGAKNVENFFRTCESDSMNFEALTIHTEHKIGKFLDMRVEVESFRKHFVAHFCTSLEFSETYLIRMERGLTIATAQDHFRNWCKRHGDNRVDSRASLSKYENKNSVHSKCDRKTQKMSKMFSDTHKSRANRRNQHTLEHRKKIERMFFWIWYFFVKFLTRRYHAHITRLSHIRSSSFHACTKKTFFKFLISLSLNFPFLRLFLWTFSHDEVLCRAMDIDI